MEAPRLAIPVFWRATWCEATPVRVSSPSRITGGICTQTCMIRRTSATITVFAGSWTALSPHSWPTWRRCGPRMDKTLLEKTFIVCMGEFGRTGGELTINKGRDHNRSAFSAVFAGAGVKGGRAFGVTDSNGVNVLQSEWNEKRSIYPEDVMVTIYSLLGIDWTKKITNTPSGRAFEYIEQQSGHRLRSLPRNLQSVCVKNLIMRNAYVAGRIALSACTVAGLYAVEIKTSWPEPRYQVRVEENVQIPMRDGIKLSTDLYFPVDAGSKLPVILIRTPYDKAPYLKPKSAAREFSRQGYVVAVQDTRGRHASEGEYTAFAGDVTDGYDTTDWLAKQSWSNGNIGSYGCSYVGDVQILQSQLRHPNLKAMIPQAAGSSIGAAGDRYYYFGARKAGNMDFASGLGWFSNQGNKVRTQPAPQIPDSKLREVWGTLPLVGMVERAGGAPSDWDNMVSRELTDPWWDQFGYLKGNERFNVPALHIGSWYDFGVAEVLLEFNLLRTNAESA